MVGSLLHDIGWKLARRDPTSEAAMTEGAAAAVSQEAPEEDCVAAKLGRWPCSFARFVGLREKERLGIQMHVCGCFD